MSKEGRIRSVRLLMLLMLPLCIANASLSSAQSAGAPSDNPSGKAKTERSAPANPTPSQDSDDPTTYRIGVEDDLAISVWKEPEFSQVVTVRPDGKITLPLVDDISVIGLKTSELQEVLTEKLKPFVNEPQVTVAVRTIRSRKVYIVGKALKQGTFPLNGRTTVLQLLADAGGLTPFAKGGSIRILRKQAGKEIQIPFNYKKALAGQAVDPVLMPGDMVIIP